MHVLFSCALIEFRVLGDSNKDSKWCRRTSILSRSFRDCLTDKELLAYFIQFLTLKDNAHLIRFWLAAENFYEASIHRIRSSSHTLDSQYNLPTSSSSSPVLSVQTSNSSSQPDLVTESQADLQES